MKKTSIVHTRISPEVKRECDKIFTKLGFTTSYAITLFLNQVVLRKGIPFEVVIPEEGNEKKSNEVKPVVIDKIKETPAPAPAPVIHEVKVSPAPQEKGNDQAKEIMDLYEKGIINFETAEAALMKLQNK